MTNRTPKHRATPIATPYIDMTIPRLIDKIEEDMMQLVMDLPHFPWDQEDEEIEKFEDREMKNAYRELISTLAKKHLPRISL